MKRCCIFFLLLAPLSAQVSVEAGKRAELRVFDATSVVSLDSNIADATLSSGVVVVEGINRGETRLVIIGPGGMQEVPVSVILGRPILPPNFVPPESVRPQEASFETRYDSARREFDNSVDIRSQSGDRLQQIHITSATAGPGGQGINDLPSAFYRYADHAFDATLLDQTVFNSPLTLDGVVLRGLHISADGFQFHAGYTASALFYDFILPAEKEIAAGISYREKIGTALKITPNFYVISSPLAVSPQPRIAALGSVLAELRLPQSWSLKSEVAQSHGFAFASELIHERGPTVFQAHLRDRPLSFPALHAGNLPGLLGDFSWIQPLHFRLSLQSGGNVSRIQLGTLRENTSNASTNLRYQWTKHLSIGSGVVYGSFSGSNYPASKTTSLVEQVNLERQAFGAGLLYQVSKASYSFAHGQEVRQTTRFTSNRWQASEFADFQTEALSVQSLESDIPGLEQELTRLGMTAVTPDQIASLLRDGAFLASLGLSANATILTVPRRISWGGDLGFNFGGARADRLSFNFIQNRNRFPTSSSVDSSVTGSYIRHIGTKTQLQASISWLRTSLLPASQAGPMFSIGLRHTFSSSLGLLSTQKHGDVTGVVFVDPRREGVFADGMEIIEGATVILDGRRALLTDRAGRFDFDHVSEGTHHIEVQLATARRFFFTTPRETVVSSGGEVNFGIAYDTIQLSGYVKDDAGNGLENIAVDISGQNGQTRLTTGKSGRFLWDNVPPGNYSINVVPDTAPVGYATENLEPAAANVTAEASDHPELIIAAVRVLTGSVTRYEPTAGRYLPVAGAEILLPQLGRRAVTNAAGKFTIGGLPAGQLEVKVVTEQSSITQMILFPVAPSTLRDDLRVSSITGAVEGHVTEGQ